MKQRLPFLLLVCIMTLAVLPARALGQVQLSDVTYEGFRNVRTNGNNSTYGQSLTHRYVDGELRFLTIAHGGMLHEFRIASTALGGTVTATTGTWDLSTTDGLNNFNGIWFEQAKNRLWLASAEDYTNINHPAKITLISLSTNGTATALKTFYLNVPAKRVYGGCNAVPASLVSQLGGPYVCGWGGYTSLVEQGGSASIGPTMYAIGDPDSVANGGTLQARTILDAAGNRGVRATIPTNYFDGGDPRQNPSSRPTSEPVSTASWLSPNATGQGWMVWGDSYYNTGVWIGTTYAAVASVCQGSCWYQSSTLAFDGRQFELHLWNGSSLGSGPLTRPSAMTELNLPRANSIVWGGNSPTGNIAGATFDAVTGRLYMIGFPFGSDPYTGRLYSYTVNGFGGGSVPPPSSDGTAPSVTISSPAAGATVSGAVTLGATASDNVGVTGVWFSVDGTTVGTEDSAAPYQTSWNSSSVANGGHTIRAFARDAAGNVTASTVVNIVVSNGSIDTTAPTSALSAPAAGSTVSGVVTVSATASDNVGVTFVQFKLNGVNLGAADTSAPYSINWSTTGAANGVHTLTAMAGDAAGSTTTSVARTVTVNNPTQGDTTAPVVSLTAPTAGATVSGSATVSATASDNVGVSSVQFRLNGVNLGSADTTSPYAISWSTSGAANGVHSLQAVAYDSAGNSTTSATVSVSVNNTTPPPSSDTTAPSVSVTGPNTSATLSGTFTLTASASDNVGVVSVQFLVDGLMVGAADNTSPYAVSWNSATVSNTTHSVQAIARDAAGNTRTSSSLTISTRNSAADKLAARAVPGDLNGDRIPDLVFQHDNGQLHSWFMSGESMTGNSALTPGAVNPVWQVVGLDDFTLDNKSDILWQHRDTGQLNVWTMNGTSMTGTEGLGAASSDWRVEATGDLNGDGSTDLVWQHPTTGAVKLWLMNGRTLTVEAGLSGPKGSLTWRVAGSGDFNRDGRIDILFRHAGTGALSVSLMSSDGRTVSSDVALSPGAASTDWLVKSVGDFNRDGSVDVIWQHARTGHLYIWYLNDTRMVRGSYLNPGSVRPEWRIVGGK